MATWTLWGSGESVRFDRKASKSLAFYLTEVKAGLYPKKVKYR